MSVEVRGDRDATIDLLAQALERYDAEHPGSQVVIYRQNSVSVRVRIVDPGFASSSRAERHEAVWRYFEGLPEEVQSEISLLLPLTPEELPRSFANLEFDHPVPSGL
jgi:hypothetical protein